MALNKFNISSKIEKVAVMKRQLPILLANDARNFFVKSWENQGFQDSGLEKWKPRAKETRKTVGKSILVGTGNLRKAVRNSIRDVSFDKIRLVVDLAYAKRHNEGLDGMPKREFMGISKTLTKQQTAIIIKYMNTKVWA